MREELTSKADACLNHVDSDSMLHAWLYQGTHCPENLRVSHVLPELLLPLLHCSLVVKPSCTDWVCFIVYY